MLKEILLETGYFVDNQYLDDYIELIQRPFYFSDYSETHHIIPVAYYKYKFNTKQLVARKLADKDPNNLKIRLKYIDHCKAHWLLYNCTIGELKQDNAIAFLYMINKKEDKYLKYGMPKSEYAVIQQYKNNIINSKKTKYYSVEEKKFLIDNANKLSIVELSVALNRSPESIHQQLRNLKINKNRIEVKRKKKPKKPIIKQQKIKEEKIIISLEIPDTLNTKLANYAMTQKTTKSKIVRQLLEEYINKSLN